MWCDFILWNKVGFWANECGALKEDVGNMYIDWAVNQGFAVLDVNIPQALTMEDVCTLYLLGVWSWELTEKGRVG